MPMAELVHHYEKLLDGRSLPTLSVTVHTTVCTCKDVSVTARKTDGEFVKMAPRLSVQLRDTIGFGLVAEIKVAVS